MSEQPIDLPPSLLDKMVSFCGSVHQRDSFYSAFQGAM